MELPSARQERRILVRREAPTSAKYGKRPEERTIPELLDFGVVVIDKPAGPTSHQVSAYVKGVLHVEKAGHSGTLDPKVTGLLPVCLGRGTRLAQSLLVAGKEYVTLMHLHREMEEYQLRKQLATFQGKIMQLPPVKSAVKRRLRERTIYYLEVLDVQGQDILFRAGTEAGTYIRKLCHDMGQTFTDDKGSLGAHMLELRRTKAGPFTEHDLVTVHALADAYHYFMAKGEEQPLRQLVQPGERALAHLPKVWVLDSTVESLCNGVQLKVPGISKVQEGIQEGNLVAVLTLKEEAVLIGRAKLTSDAMMGEKGIALKSEQVFMQTGTYPRAS